MEFIPFDATEEEIATRQVLRPGVPDSMRKPLITWIWIQMKSDHSYVRAPQLHTLENNLDISFGMNAAFAGLINETEFRKLLDPLAGQSLLRVADLLLFKAGKFGRNADSLGRVLAEARSQYEVVRRETSYRLATRLPEGVQEAAESLMSTTETGGILLRKAWSKLYELNPDDSGAYSAAVKAVESVALPALGISKETATISDAVRAIEKKGALWRLPFKREHTEYPSQEVLLGMLKSLYRGQRDRHGSASYSDVTHDEAEAAVLMAVTLVGLFARQLVQERDGETFG